MDVVLPQLSAAVAAPLSGSCSDVGARLTGLPNTTVTSPLFGSVTETQSNDPRFVQLAFRFSY